MFVFCTNFTLRFVQKNKPRESNYRNDSADLISSLQQQFLPEHTKYNSLTV